MLVTSIFSFYHNVSMDFFLRAGLFCLDWNNVESGEMPCSISVFHELQLCFTPVYWYQSVKEYYRWKSKSWKHWCGICQGSHQQDLIIWKIKQWLHDKQAQMNKPLTHYHTMMHFEALKAYSCGKREKRRNCLLQATSNFSFSHNVF